MQASLLLCDYAQVNNGKLYVVGAAVSLVGTPSLEPPYPIHLGLAALVTVPWSAHNQLHTLRISVKHEDGALIPIANPAVPEGEPEEFAGRFVAKFNAGRGPQMQPGDDSLIPLAVPLQAGHPTLGGYVASLEVDGTELATARYRLVQMQQVAQISV